MSYYFHAVAVDYDGTLTERARPDDDVLAAIREVRESGRVCVLVTGRILTELRADFPDVDHHFDAIVAENGAVLARGEGTERPLTAPVSLELEAALGRRGVPLRRGLALLATDAVHGAVVHEEIARLGLEYQLVRNRGALMVLPAGVTKGTGLLAALAQLGISQHSTVAIGDAENDHSFLDAGEIGVAVANAVPSLRARADLVLDAPAGAGVAAFLRGPLQDGLPGLEPRRWRIRLGVYEDGASATIPASHVNVGIFGASGAGKSYVAGLLAEQLVAMRYATCILDLEGDHAALGNLHGAVVVGGRHPLPRPASLARLLTQGLLSVVVDLSLHPEEAKRSYALELLDELRRTRRQCGIPQWIIVDEAHVPMGADLQGWWCADARETGLCLVTYRPEQLCPHACGRAEFVITLDPAAGATLARRGEPPRRFRPAERALPHVRHWRKYVEGRLPLHRQFVFRRSDGPIGVAAGNVPEFAAAIEHAGADVLRHHAAHLDFSRWLGDLDQDPDLVRAVRDLEQALAAPDTGDQVEALRARLLDVLGAHFTERLEPPGRQRTS
ncbi:MAG: HAD hydrolase family protein [Gemmatimonadetes bacterium]|nr:HAD hydrolase family protein [Gemmatimonadota bacterium]